MTPAFGFSVGDFISVINLVRKISNALKASGGAAHEYQHVIIELKGLEAVLQLLEALEPTEDNISHVNAIRGMALACQFPLRDFLIRLEKYDSSMSPFGKPLNGARHKAKWAISTTDEVERLRRLIAAKVVSINLLLATHASQTLSKLEASSRIRHAGLMAEIVRQEQHALQVDDNLEEIKLQTSTATTELTQQIQGATDTTGNHLQSVGKQILDFLGSFSSEFRDMLRKITQTDIRIYQLLLKVQQDIAATPTNLLNSNISFEDALGRRRELPYEYFRH